MYNEVNQLMFVKTKLKIIIFIRKRSFIDFLIAQYNHMCTDAINNNWICSVVINLPIDERTHCLCNLRLSRSPFSRKLLLCIERMHLLI